MKLFSGLLGCALSMGMLFSVSSCSENIDEGNFAIKTELTATDYITENPDRFSSFKAIIDRVQLGNKEDGSSISAVLSARGNYTVFAPNNEAIAAYMQENGIPSLEEMNDTIAQLIAYSCIIDNEDNAAYETPDFPTPGSFAKTNLNNRALTSALDSTGVFIISGNAPVRKENIEVSNGMIHEVDSVIAPSSDNIFQLVSIAGNMQIASYLIQATGWDSVMSSPDRDREYEKEPRELQHIQSTIEYRPFAIMQYRYLGYTALLETDDVYESEWGVRFERDASTGEITNLDEAMRIITEKCEAAYGTSARGDLKDGDNAVNRFVAYHFIDGRMAYDRLVRHYNEYGYNRGADGLNPQTKNCPTNVWDYYTTLGDHPGLIKITQVGDQGFELDTEHSIYANRISIYNNSRNGDYKELGVKDAGILISPDNGEYDNDGQNGFYFPINKILLNDAATQDKLGAERIRMDLTTMLPELLSNSIRGTDYTYLPHGYCNNITQESDGTNILYLNEGPVGTGWVDGQGDEFLFTGLFDFVIKMPPVPKNGTYEIRMGISQNSLRGMAQIYFGDDPYQLEPAGLPCDMRQVASESNINCPWIKDTDDEITNIENDKNMRNQGYMKAPRYYTRNSNSNNPDNLRDLNNAVRRIITTKYLRSGETYYIRFKTALKKLDAQFFLDYFEYVPANIYNGAEPEDVW